MITLLIWVVPFSAGFYFVYKRGVTANIFFEILYACLLAGRVYALFNGECYRMTYEWEGYIFRWTVNVIFLLILLVLGAVTLRRHKSRSGIRTAVLFSCYNLAAIVINNAIWEFYWRHP